MSELGYCFKFEQVKYRAVKKNKEKFFLLQDIKEMAGKMAVMKK